MERHRQSAEVWGFLWYQNKLTRHAPYYWLPNPVLCGTEKLIESTQCFGVLFFSLYNFHKNNLFEVPVILNLALIYPIRLFSVSIAKVAVSERAAEVPKVSIEMKHLLLRSTRETSKSCNVLGMTIWMIWDKWVRDLIIYFSLSCANHEAIILT